MDTSGRLWYQAEIKVPVVHIVLVEMLLKAKMIYKPLTHICQKSGIMKKIMD